MEKIAITNNPTISAIYYALLQCGYDYYALERNEEHICVVEAFRQPATLQPFFTEVKQSTCEVYPYWPRAAMLETASFYLNSVNSSFADFEKYRDLILSAGNIANEERDSHFWNWITDFPKAMKSVMDSKAFTEYLEWEDGWIAQQNTIYTEELAFLQTCLTHCVKEYKSPVKRIQIVLSPIKCVYSSDYHLVDDCFVFSSGRFRTESVIHEFLHHVVHPVVLKYRGNILSHERQYPGIDESYYLAGDAAGRLNAFEEFAVRSLTKSFVDKALPFDLDAFVRSI